MPEEGINKHAEEIARLRRALEQTPEFVEFSEVLADMIVEAVELSLKESGGLKTHEPETLSDDLLEGARRDDGSKQLGSNPHGV